MPILEHHIGLVRAGAWSISFELCCLLPAMMAFFFGTGVYGEQGPVWNQVLLFGGIALSRVGLWSFDLCQVRPLFPIHLPSLRCPAYCWGEHHD